MLKLIIALLIMAGAVSIAEARTCSTTCSTVGNYTTCQQNCW